jgi:hypothetical protein
VPLFEKRAFLREIRGLSRVSQLGRLLRNRHSSRRCRKQDKPAQPHKTRASGNAGISRGLGHGLRAEQNLLREKMNQETSTESVMPAKAGIQENF